jgi:drug/metabolite transporter (DMT)-like permease
MAHKAGLFDLRLVIAMLFAIFGVVLLVVGLGFTEEADLAKADGLNINLWSGVGMVVLSALFAGWAALRPVIVPDAGAPGPGGPGTVDSGPVSPGTE